GTASDVAAQPQGTPTPIPIVIDVAIPAGETYAFYVTTTDSVRLNYTAGAAVGNVFAADENIQFLEGAGNEYPFQAAYSPRIFNGVIHYATDYSYPTTIAEDGARHLAAGPTLGANRDIEDDALPNPAATGDDATGAVDDEDGVTFVASTLWASTLSTNATARVEVNLQNADPASNRLDAWIDFNGDSDWDDPGERIFDNYSLGTANGVQTLAFTIPQAIDGAVTSGAAYARFRLSTAGGLAPTGAANDGEVEDYRITISIINPTPGDADLDGMVGDGDAQILAAHWGMSGVGWNEGDFTDDGRVDAADAAILAANWGATWTLPGEEAAPPAPGDPTPASEATSLIGPIPTTTARTVRRRLEPAAVDEALAGGNDIRPAELDVIAQQQLAWFQVTNRREWRRKVHDKVTLTADSSWAQ
ncbi:MAG: hypothetical protein JW719_04255, partial [Pirellulales bacterium]|nr:hypothetical protein [Pirellulales bacterium]